jgi:hypothetical protein
LHNNGPKVGVGQMAIKLFGVKRKEVEVDVDLEKISN